MDTLQAKGLHAHFDFVVGGDQRARHKPAPDMLLLALERLGLPPHEALMVGDTTADVDAAQAAGVACRAVLGGTRDEATLRAAGADVVLAAFTDVPAALARRRRGCNCARRHHAVLSSDRLPTPDVSFQERRVTRLAGSTSSAGWTNGATWSIVGRAGRMGPERNGADVSSDNGTGGGRLKIMSSKPRKKVSYVVLLVMSSTGLSSSVAQCPPGDPSIHKFVELPRVILGPGTESTRRNYGSRDLELLEATVGGGARIRFFYTTEGSLDPNTAQLYPGHLRMADVARPLPDLAVSSPVFSNLEFVPGFNDVLGGDLPTTYGKSGSIVGMATVGTALLAHTPRRNRDEPASASQPDVAATEPWNGLAYLADATGRASTMTFSDFWSAGPGLGVAPVTEFSAVPEGADIAYSGDDTRWYVAANYCGSDWAGHLLVMKLDNLAAVDPDERVLLPLYEFLGDWLDGLQLPDKPPPTTSLSTWPLGPEVPRNYFTCPSTPTGPNCASGGPDVGGNKLRPILYVDVRVGPLDGRRLLIAGLNLDPVDLASYASGNYIRLDNAGRDDGKYDYLAIMDITEMLTEVLPEMPELSWYYKDLAAWQEHTTFVRLPPDVPAGWDWQQPAPTTPGYDWSTVNVIGVDPPPAPVFEERIVGSGTVKSIALHPNGQYVYVVASDQGQEVVAENADLGDGGWHVPHLYVLDLGVDLTDQAVCNSVSPTLPKYRLNKVLQVEYEDDGTTYYASTLVNSTLDMPTSNETGTTGLTLLGGASNCVTGPYYPGEYQTDPTARTKLVALRNTAFAQHQDRLYLGTTGRVQTTDPTAKGQIIGAVHVFSLAGNGAPSYLKTLTLPQGTAGTKKYQITGLHEVPAGHLASPAARNVVAVVATTSVGSSVAPPDNPIDRLILIQDEP